MEMIWLSWSNHRTWAGLLASRPLRKTHDHHHLLDHRPLVITKTRRSRRCRHGFMEDHHDQHHGYHSFSSSQWLPFYCTMTHALSTPLLPASLSSSFVSSINESLQRCPYQNYRSVSFSTHTKANKKNHTEKTNRHTSPDTLSDSKKSSSASSLRHLIRPFLLKCHPDAVQNYPEAKRINLVAIQTLNAFVDRMEEIIQYHSLSSSSTSSLLLTAKQESWPTILTIEFLIPISDPMTMGRQSKKPRPPTLSRRRVELNVPSWNLRQQILMTTAASHHNKPNPWSINDHEEYNRTIHRRRFQWLVQRELAKLIRVAGLSIPQDFEPTYPHDPEDEENNSSSRLSASDRAFREYLLGRDDYHDMDVPDSGMFGNRATTTGLGRRRFEESSYDHYDHTHSTSSSRVPSKILIRHPRTLREKNRDAFMSRINWKRHEQVYQQTIRGIEEDSQTHGFISKNPIRKQNFVDQLVSRIRVQRRRPPQPQTNNSHSSPATNFDLNHSNPNDNLEEPEVEASENDMLSNHSQREGSSDTADDNGDDNNTIGSAPTDQANKKTNMTEKQKIPESDFEEGEEDEVLVPVLEQLIALRRISLLFYDNFDELEMEDMGQMWETMRILLTAPRDYNTSSSAIHRRKRRPRYENDGASGFLFSYDAQNRVTVHIPVDFTDDELLDEFRSNLSDFYDMIDHQLNAEIFPGEIFASQE